MVTQNVQIGILFLNLIDFASIYSAWEFFFNIRWTFKIQSEKSFFHSDPINFENIIFSKILAVQKNHLQTRATCMFSQFFFTFALIKKENSWKTCLVHSELITSFIDILTKKSKYLAVIDSRKMILF